MKKSFYMLAPAFLTILPTLAFAAGAVDAAPNRWSIGSHRHVRRFCRPYPRHHLLGSKTDLVSCGFLLRRRRCYRIPERSCNRR